MENEEIDDPDNTHTQYDTTDTDQEFDECETPKKKLNVSLQSMGVSSMDSLHAVAEHSRINQAKRKLGKVVDNSKSNLCEAYTIDMDQINVNESNDKVNESQVNEKAIELDRLQEAMKAKLKTATYPEKIQILTLVPDKWSRKYCAEYFNVSEYLIRTARELQN